MTRAIVLGAGLSGLVCARELAARGIDVTVLEAAPFAGGRTSSWTDARGRATSTGRHVIADHYTNLLDVLARLGATRHLEWVTEHLYLRAGQPAFPWAFDDKPPPRHLLRPFRTMPLTWPSRAALGLGGLVAASYAQEDLAALDHLTYAEWHAKRRLGNGFARDLAEAGADAATFLTGEEASARAVLSWMKYMVRTSRAADVGLMRGSLADCLVAPLVAAIEKHGGRVRTSTAVVALELDEHRVRGVRVARATGQDSYHRADGVMAHAADTELLAADLVVSALPVQGLQRLLTRDQARAAGLADIYQLGTTPAVSVVVYFDRTIAPAPPGAPLVTGGAMRDLVDLAELGRKPNGAPGSVYEFVVTRARERIAHDDARIVADVVADLERAWPAARGARVVDHVVERIEAAMFAAVPGAHALRPSTTTQLANLILAGDWTRHELNASMEGAALSGRKAANAALAVAGRPQAVPVLTPPDPTVVPALRALRTKVVERWARG